jgi:DNA-binding CsgD family transcriptional regulator
VSEETASPIVIAIDIGDPALADRLAALLGNVAGLRLAVSPEAADVAIVARDQPRDQPHAAEPSESDLTPRERNVLTLMAEGASNKTIAMRLGISIHTAKFHVGSILEKLDATGRTDAVAHAARLGVIEL